MTDKINAIAMFEMLGKPAGYLKEMLSAHVEKLGKEKGIKIASSKMQEPKKVEDSELLTNFVEVELELEGISGLFSVLFGYMPCHLEIIKPENLRLSNYDLNVLGNELIRRLHEYDAVAKTAQINNANLAQQLRDAMGKIGAVPAEKEIKGKKAGKRKKSSPRK